MSPAVVPKPELRRRMIAQLARLEPGERRRAAAAATESWLAQPEADAAGILVCLAFGDEIDTAAVIERLAAAGRELFVTRADPRDRQLHVHRWPCELVTLEFGLRQPPRGAPELAAGEIAARVGAALVLGLAFDPRGFRLGHGSGYFDRFLARHPIPSLGFAFDLQLVERIADEPHDVPMHGVVTDRRVVRRSVG